MVAHSSDQFNIVKIIDNTVWYTIAKVVHKINNESYIIKTSYQKENQKLSKALILHDFRMMQQLKGRPFIPNLDRPIENKNEDLIVMEDDNSHSLAQIREDGKFTWDLFFALSTQLTLAIQEIHSNKLVHGNLTPNTILYHIEKKKLKIIDFSWAFITEYHGIGHFLPNEFHFPKHPYLSPEQKGLFNSSIDYRTDFYSLGKIFTEIITGVPIEFIHINSAIPFSQFPFIPNIIKDFLLKLMAKDPIERYQTSFALVKDLTYLHSLYQGKGQFRPAITDFQLGKYDVPRKLQLTNSLYGPKLFIHDMLHFYKYAIENGKALILLQAPFGHGKKKSIQEFLSCLGVDTFYYHEGTVKNINNSQYLIEWKQIIKSELPSDYSTIEDFFTQKNDRPHIVYFNNAQDMSLESIKILKNLMNSKKINSFFVVLEINSAISKHLKKFYQYCEFNTILRIKGKIFNIQPHDLKNIQLYLSHTLFLPEDNIKELAKVIFAKTNGSDFLLNELVLESYEQKFIQYDPIKGSWVYEINKIKQMDYQNTVIEHIKNKYINGPIEVKKFMLICALLDSPFTKNEISELFKLMALSNKKYILDWQHHFLQFLHNKIFYTKGPFYQELDAGESTTCATYQWSYSAWQDIIIESADPIELQELATYIIDEHKFSAQFGDDFSTKLFSYTSVEYWKKHPTYLNTLYYWIKNKNENSKHAQIDSIVVPYLIKNSEEIWGKDYPININDHLWPNSITEFENADDFYRFFFIYYYSIDSCIKEQNFPMAIQLLDIVKSKVDFFPGVLSKYYLLFITKQWAHYFYNQGLFFECLNCIEKIFPLFKLDNGHLFDFLKKNTFKISDTPYFSILFKMFLYYEKCAYVLCHKPKQLFAIDYLKKFISHDYYSYPFLKYYLLGKFEIKNNLDEIMKSNDSCVYSRGIFSYLWKYFDYQDIIEILEKSTTIEKKNTDTINVIFIVYMLTQLRVPFMKAHVRSVYFSKLKHQLDMSMEASFTDIIEINQCLYSFINQEKNKNDVLEILSHFNDSISKEQVFNFMFFQFTLIKIHCLLGVSTDFLQMDTIHFYLNKYFQDSYMEYQYLIYYFYYLLTTLPQAGYLTRQNIFYKMNSIIKKITELSSINEKRFFAAVNVLKITFNSVKNSISLDNNELIETILLKNAPQNFKEETALLYMIAGNFTMAQKLFDEMEYWGVKIYLNQLIL